MATGEAKERPTQVGRLIIIGVGNRHRGDDGAGPAVSAYLRDKAPKGARVVDRDGEAARLIETWKDADAVILIDAVSSNAPPGTIHEIDAGESTVPPDLFACSTHSFGVAEAVELSRALGSLPGVFWIYGIEGAEFAAGADFSAEVKAAIEDTGRRVLERANRIVGAGTDDREKD
jgi:hydrogenase maturation protease